jgi:AmpE protein
MSITLIAVIFALFIGHAMPALVALRRYDWFIRWLEWLAAQLGDNPSWRGAGGLLFAVGPPLLLVALLQVGLHGDFYGFPAFVFAVLALFYAWGPRDLDRDVEAVVEAADPAARREAAMRLFPDRDPDAEAPALDGASLVEAVFRCALWRWFGVLFWFLLLGAFGALLYRLVSLCAQGEARKRLPEGASQAARTLLAFLDWPVAQLMTLSLALVGNFDSVFSAWKESGGAGYSGDTRFLAAAARASVRSELAEEALDDIDSDYVADGGVAVSRSVPGLPELRDAMSLVWRILLLWLAVLALFVIAGWVA